LGRWLKKWAPASDAGGSPFTVDFASTKVSGKTFRAVVKNGRPPPARGGSPFTVGIGSTKVGGKNFRAVVEEKGDRLRCRRLALHRGLRLNESERQNL
ncbi:MAG: hypothetical protein IJ668_08200, partial [Selenomonadaceae bacterium]|nr:hypothetical protein [Selenomonadaceae bacterium]